MEAEETCECACCVGGVFEEILIVFLVTAHFIW